MNKLSQSTIEHLNYYVYLLIDPRNKKAFYVGKGKGSRILNHITDALFDDTDEIEKIARIHDINESGYIVQHTILRHGLTQKEAFEVECAAIDLLGIKNLTNIVAGHYSAERGLMTLEDIEIKYQAQKAKFNHSAMLININRLFYRGMSQDELYEATRKHWRIDIVRAEKVEIVCAVYIGIIREVYTHLTWHKSPKEEIGRHYFDGNIAPEEIRSSYINKSVAEFWKRGSQNPIKYVENEI